MTISVCKIPYDNSQPLEKHFASWDTEGNFGKEIREILSLDDFLETPLLRPRANTAGLYAYHNVPNDKNGLQNVRATRLAMACGLLHLRFWGDVLVVRSFGGKWLDLGLEEINGACCVSPDLRTSVQEGMAPEQGADFHSIPRWLANAAQNNYHDAAALALVIDVMKGRGPGAENSGESDADEEDSHGGVDDSDDGVCVEPSKTVDITTHRDNGSSGGKHIPNEFVTKDSLCLHCRRPCDVLCRCDGAYFCPGERDCRLGCWSHECNCPTWARYCSRSRERLSEFKGLANWHHTCLGRPFQKSQSTYEDFLCSILEQTRTEIVTSHSWWKTEFGGWMGGKGTTSMGVDARVRLSYEEGFAPISSFPVERAVTETDLCHAGLSKRNDVGLLEIRSWNEYYKLRHIDSTSPVALLCTFPLTIYQCVYLHGAVPITVSRMLRRPLRIHVIGAEKEINFLDLFKEVGYLMPADLKVSF